MNKKTLKVLIAAILVIISAFSFNFVVLAEPDDDSDFVSTEVPSDGEDIDATEESKKEASKAASEKAEKIKKLIEQEEEPSESDLEEFSESEQNYIMKARF